MKKLFALLMALCLMTAVLTAIAEELEVRPVLQDEAAPKLVVTEENGQKIIAKICDANGNVLAVILDDGTVALTDVHQRAEGGERLVNAYNELMQDVHFSDVESAKHDEKLKKDINDSIATDTLSAYDMLVYEVFDVALNNPETEALLTDGAYIEFVVELKENQSAPTLIKTSQDGLKWELLDHCTVDGSTVTIRMEKPGVVGFMKPYDVAPEQPVVIETEEVVTTYETVMVEAEGLFTPSVSGKPAPQLVPFVNEKNEVVKGYIYTTETAEPVAVGNDSSLVITPVADSFYVEDIQTHEHLQWSFDSILKAEQVQHIRTGIGAEIDGQLKADGFSLTHFDMIVRDLFDVSLYGELLEQFYNEDAYLEMTFEEKELDPNQALVVIFSEDSQNWHVLPHSMVTINGNDTVTIKLPGLGTVAFLVEKAEELPSGAEVVSSPE